MDPTDARRTQGVLGPVNLLMFLSIRGAAHHDRRITHTAQITFASLIVHSSTDCPWAPAETLASPMTACVVWLSPEKSASQFHGDYPIDAAADRQDPCDETMQVKLGALGRGARERIIPVHFAVGMSRRGPVDCWACLTSTVTG